MAPTNCRRCFRIITTTQKMNHYELDCIYETRNFVDK